MKIDWNLSPKLIEKAKHIKRLKDEGKTYEYIASEIKNHRVYVITLYQHYLKMQKGGEDHVKTL